MNTEFEWLTGGGVTSAQGFLACGVAAGIKANRNDMAMVLSERPATAAGLFTSNRAAAAPVVVDRERVASGRCRGVVVNAGCANACTGPGGFADAVAMAKMAADAVQVPESEMLVSSTGTIGRRLPMDRVAEGVRLAKGALRRDGGDEAAHAIMTTDTVAKQAALRVRIGGADVVVGGMCKGAGMICPNLATMLCYITTDAAIEPADLDAALRRAAGRSFNRITVDGDQSTNDSLVVFANGASGVAIPAAPHPDFERFAEALGAVAESLAKQIVADGEGATKFVTVAVDGAASDADALLAARAVANSPLFKTACFGADPNWGRVICAVGNSGAAFDAMKTRIFFDDVCAYDRGAVADAAANERLAKVMANPAFTTRIDLGLGDGSDAVYTCDFSYEYVKINGEYTT
ncbi:MAG: bifunctional glutamate N-acetyltransferase/amino-acid acetyltransferase ArgJ [Kiritimatiellia bacterium]|jgi:glutamate N-acetyltransferase/amino-acid N-acetyltransferase